MKLLSIGAVVAGILASGAAPAFAGTQAFEDPNATAGNTGTYATGVNNVGDVAGYWVDSSGNANSFVDVGGTFTEIGGPSVQLNFPPTTLASGWGTIASGISTTGGGGDGSAYAVIGLATPPVGSTGNLVTSSLINHAYNYQFGAIFNGGTPFPVVASPVGYELISQGEVAYVPSVGGSNGYFGPTPSSTFGHVTITGISTTTYSLVGNGDNGPNLLPFTIQGATNTISSGTTNQGNVVGSYQDASGNWHGYVIAQPAANSVVTPTLVLNYPGAVNTFVTSINQAGDVAGYYTDASGNEHGFVYINGRYGEIDAAVLGLTADLGTTVLTGIADGPGSADLVSGFYTNTWGVVESFTTTVPEPATIAILGAPLALLVARRRSPRKAAL